MPNHDLSLQNTEVPLQPVAPSERIPALDVVRGFALFGVLLAYALWNLGAPPEEAYGNTDRVLSWVLSALIDMKFYTLFAFLFGLGFSIQLTRAEAGGVSVVPVYCRRLLALFLIGLAHALLLRNGDILVPYAVTGLLLLLFRRASNKTLAVGAIIGLVYPSLARGVWGLTGIPFPQRPEGEGLGYFAENFAWVRYWYSIAITFWPASAPMFLFGLYTGRRRFFDNVTGRRRTLWRILIAGLSIGALAYIVRVWLFLNWVSSAPSFGQRLTWETLWSAHAWGLAACYTSSLLLLYQRAPWQRWLAPLGAVGRMALTNYLLQAALLIPVCAGFGLFGRITPSLGLPLALAVWSLQVPASVWWLRRFRFGPAEWIWRSLTYGSPQPMRIADESIIAAGA